MLRPLHDLLWHLRIRAAERIERLLEVLFIICPIEQEPYLPQRIVHVQTAIKVLPFTRLREVKVQIVRQVVGGWHLGRLVRPNGQATVHLRVQGVFGLHVLVGARRHVQRVRVLVHQVVVCVRCRLRDDAAARPQLVVPLHSRDVLLETVFDLLHFDEVVLIRKVKNG